jgi:hypothetical protein
LLAAALVFLFVLVLWSGTPSSEEKKMFVFGVLWGFSVLSVVGFSLASFDELRRYSGKGPASLQ